MVQHNIWVTGSDPLALSETARVLEKDGYKVTVVSDGDDVLEPLNAYSLALVLIDLTSGGPAVSSRLQAVRKKSPETMIVLQGDPMDASSMETMFNSGADDCICKPYKPEELRFRVGKNIEIYELKQKARLRKRFFSNCCVCKKIRVDDYGPVKDRWMEVENFLKEEMDILLSSTYCPKCAKTAQEDLQVHLDRLKA